MENPWRGVRPEKPTSTTELSIGFSVYNSVAHKLLIDLIRKDVSIFTTNGILEEFANVLERDFGYEQIEIDYIIGKISQFVKIVNPKEEIKVVDEDPDDNKIIECAVESNSDVIITYDKHLLNIKEYKGIKILKPEFFR